MGKHWGAIIFYREGAVCLLGGHLGGLRPKIFEGPKGVHNFLMGERGGGAILFPRGGGESFLRLWPNSLLLLNFL